MFLDPGFSRFLRQYGYAPRAQMGGYHGSVGAPMPVLSRLLPGAQPVAAVQPQARGVWIEYPVNRPANAIVVSASREGYPAGVMAVLRNGAHIMLDRLNTVDAQRWGVAPSDPTRAYVYAVPVEQRGNLATLMVFAFPSEADPTVVIK